MFFTCFIFHVHRCYIRNLTLKLSQSSHLYKESQKYIVGGVNSPVRAFRFVGGVPRFISQGQGAYLTDNDGHQYVDYVNSWGAAIVGHANPDVVKAVCERAHQGLSFGAPTAIEMQLARKISQYIPSMELMRFVCSGTEACMSAVRLARAYRKKDGVLKFSGHYHGHSDSLLASAGSGVQAYSKPDSPGVTEGSVQSTFVAPFNDVAALERAFSSYGSKLACVILEVVAGNCGMILPQHDFLEMLIYLTDKYGVLLIADEVMTGFRVHLGGAQSIYRFRPHITVLGKVIGGGMPIGAFGGRREILENLAPEGDVYQAGTLAGNPVAMAAGLSTLDILSQENVFAQMSAYTSQLILGLQERANACSLPLQVVSLGGMFGMFFAEKEQVILCIDDVKSLNHNFFKQFFHLMLQRGIYFPPSPYEACFVSIAHGNQEMNKTLDAAEEVFVRMRSML